jgi:hypothetical protein
VVSSDRVSESEQQFQVQWVIHHVGRAFSFACLGQPTVRPANVGEQIWSALRVPHVELQLEAAQEGCVETIWVEAQRVVHGPQPLILPDGRSTAVEIRGEHLVRTVSNGTLTSTDTTNGRAHDLTTLLRNWETVQAGSGGSHEEQVQLGAFSPAGRRALNVLDAVARRNVAQRYGRKLDELASTRGGPLPAPLRHFRVFLSYRRPALTLAQELHRVLGEFAGGAHFETFLDLHDTTLGDWAKQYFDAIERCDLFLVLCTAGYAASGTFSKVELEHALTVGAQIGIVRPGVPDEDLPPVWDEKLKDYDACILPDEAGLTAGNPVLDRYLAKCVTALRGTRK